MFFAGWKPYNLLDLVHVSWVVWDLYCTDPAHPLVTAGDNSHDLDDLDDVDDLDHGPSEVCNFARGSSTKLGALLSQRVDVIFSPSTCPTRALGTALFSARTSLMEYS